MITSGLMFAAFVQGRQQQGELLQELSLILNARMKEKK